MINCALNIFRIFSIKYYPNFFYIIYLVAELFYFIFTDIKNLNINMMLQLYKQNKDSFKKFRYKHNASIL